MSDKNSVKILYGITKSNWGGAQRYVYDLALASKRAGHDVAVLAGGSGALIQKLKSENIRIIPLPYIERNIKISNEIKGAWNIYRILKQEGPDVFHVNSSKLGGLGALAARLSGVKKIIFTAHGWAFNEPRAWWQKILIEEIAWLTVLLSHRTICVSEAIKRAVEDKPFIKDRLVTIHNGIEPFPVARRKRHDEKLVVGTVAELHRVKGLDVGIRGFARAFKYTDTVYEIVGEGDDRAYLQNLVKELGVEEQVRFLGFREDARERLSEFDIFVLPSRSEALGYALLEAGIAKLPVVASKVGGIPEVVKDEDTGILFESQRFQELADKLKILAGDRQLRETLGKNLHKFVTESFGKDRMAEKTMRLYAA